MHIFYYSIKLFFLLLQFFKVLHSNNKAVFLCDGFFFLLLFVICLFIFVFVFAYLVYILFKQFFSLMFVFLEFIMLFFFLLRRKFFKFLLFFFLDVLLFFYRLRFFFFFGASIQDPLVKIFFDTFSPLKGEILMDFFNFSHKYFFDNDFNIPLSIFARTPLFDSAKNSFFIKIIYNLFLEILQKQNKLRSYYYFFFKYNNDNNKQKKMERQALVSHFLAPSLSVLDSKIKFKLLIFESIFSFFYFFSFDFLTLLDFINTYLNSNSRFSYFYFFLLKYFTLIRLSFLFILINLENDSFLYYLHATLYKMAAQQYYSPEDWNGLRNIYDLSLLNSFAFNGDSRNDFVFFFKITFAYLFVYFNFLLFLFFSFIFLFFRVFYYCFKYFNFFITKSSVKYIFYDGFVFFENSFFFLLYAYFLKNFVNLFNNVLFFIGRFAKIFTDFFLIVKRKLQFRVQIRVLKLSLRKKKIYYYGFGPFVIKIILDYFVFFFLPFCVFFYLRN